jgi:hypothetical protein
LTKPYLPRDLRFQGLTKDDPGGLTASLKKRAEGREKRGERVARLVAMSGSGG